MMSVMLSVVMALAFCGCNDEDGGDEGTKTDGGLVAGDNILAENATTIGNGDQEFVFTGKQTLKKGVYLLKGWVYIKDGAELTIEPGTIIKGDKQTKAALIVERGGKLFAKGTASEPIVFTSEEAAGSRRPGDWGGLILCGKARNNQQDMQIEGGPRTHHGGEDDGDSSGALSYVRVEFAGYPFEKDKEINGITFGSVGSGTQIDHLQVSYSNDDSYEWFGGTVNCSHLVAFHGWDDEFDTDNGFSGKVQFCLSVRNPRIADVSQANGFESDNNADGSTASPYTTATFCNVTFVGPMGRDEAFVNDGSYITGGDMNPGNGSDLGKFQSAMQVRRNSRLSCYNSVAVGYPIGLILDNEKGDTQGAATAGNLALKGIYFAGMGITGSDANKVYEDKEVEYVDGKAKVVESSLQSFSSAFFLTAGFGNKVFEAADALMLTGVDSKVGVNYLPQAGSPLLSGSVSVPAGFASAAYVGAFSGENDTWLNGWTEFDPQHADYSNVK